jgi:hypothetical protein
VIDTSVVIATGVANMDMVGGYHAIADIAGRDHESSCSGILAVVGVAHASSSSSVSNHKLTSTIILTLHV